MGNTLRDVRMEGNLTQKELARNVGVTQRAISYYESGIRKPSPDVANRIAALLSLSIEEVWNMFYKAS